MGKLITFFDFFKRRYSNDLETNTSGATLPTTNIKIPIMVNFDVPIEENPNITIEENVCQCPNWGKFSKKISNS